ncbi:MAG: ABC transporter permease [Spirochaetales bacterium]|nr:ABC transporter permease [Spirochaetales bacterium]
MITSLGRWFNRKVVAFFYAMGYFFQVLKETIKFIMSRHVGLKVLRMQILFTGVEALGITAILAVSLGAVIIIQGVSLLPQFGQGQLIYTILITVITRELGPLLTAFIIIARSGTAIATELGTMTYSHEVEAYISVGINPIAYLVVPRVLGVTISLLLLNIYFNLFGLIASYFVTQFFTTVQFLEYFRNLLQTLTTSDIFSSLIKSVVFGVIISTIATFYGLHLEQSSTEIPIVVIKAVAHSVVVLLLADVFITLIYYM